MKVGTKSVLFGAHAFWLHGWFVAAAWWKLYGFPTQLWLWVAFFVHDLGYWGKGAMDDEEGETHPLLGEKLLNRLQAAYFYITHPGMPDWNACKLIAASEHLDDRPNWGRESLLHSRFYAKKLGQNPSRLCWADKYSITLIPWWLYLPMTIATGEVWEYVNKDKHHSDMAMTHEGKTWGGYRWRDAYHWFIDLQAHMKNVSENRLHAPT
jgi:hypothetical protein